MICEPLIHNRTMGSHKCRTRTSRKVDMMNALVHRLKLHDAGNHLLVRGCCHSQSPLEQEVLVLGCPGWSPCGCFRPVDPAEVELASARPHVSLQSVDPA